MNPKTLWLSILAVIISFLGGFFLANSLNRSELAGLRTENEQLKKNQADDQLALSDEEIRQRITQADRNAADLEFQKNLGLALTQYGAMKKDAGLIAEALRLLTRAHAPNSRDYDLMVGIGNAHFQIGLFNNDSGSFARAREFYRKALEQKPTDAGVRTNLGLTHFLVNPPELDTAVAEFQKALETNPKDERTLQLLTESLIRQNKFAEAEKYFEQLRAVNANNPVLQELSAQIAQGKLTEPPK